MKQIDSLTRLRLKIVGGYVSLIALFVVASVIVVCKNGDLEDNSKRYKENVDRRAFSEGAFLQLFDLTQLGGQAAIWDSTRIAAYEKKEKCVMLTLDSMIMAIPDTAQVRRVKEIKQLVTEKKGYLLAIHQECYGAYQAIKRRKLTVRAAFLESMLNGLHNRMKEDDRREQARR